MQLYQSLLFRYTRLVIIPLVGVLFTVISYLFTPDEVFQFCQNKFGQWYIVVDLVSSLVLVTIVSESSIILCKILEKNKVWTQFPGIAITTQYLVHSIVSMFTTWLLARFNVVMYGYEIEQLLMSDIEMFYIYIVVLMFSLFLSSTYTLMFIFDKLKQSLTEQEQTRTVIAQAQVAALRAQLNPHFLFNSLNTLVNLIEEEPKEAVRFVQEMAYVYRYVLKSEDTTTLNQEIEFAHHYIELMKIRFGDALHLHIDIEPALLSVHIPVMTLQILLENVCTHTVVHADEPMTLRMYSPDKKSIVIENPLRSKTYNTAGNGIGLRNLEERLRMLCDATLTKEQTHEFFRVHIEFSSV